MEKRPISITIVSWFLIISGLVSGGSMAFTYDSPEVARMMELNALPVPFQFAMMVVGTIITIGSGILMLKGKDIGRIAYVGWAVITLALGVFASPSPAMMIPSLVIVVLLTFFLFRPKANAFFSHRKEAASSAS